MALISLKNACVDFTIYNSSNRSIKKRVLGSVGGLVKNSNSGQTVVRALSSLNLELNSGDKLAVIGHNVAGKSTLLKLLSGIYEPTEGSCSIIGQTSSLLDMTMGMDFELTGKENIILRSVLLGKSFTEAKELIDDIVEFSQLGDYIDLPMRTYSSGMVLRLAFGISTAVHPAIILLDEVIGVGDANFAERSKKRLTDMLSKASIMVLASHNNDILREYCNKAIQLEGGKIIRSGTIEELLNQPLDN
jgi:ABC-2 type transport system ATP-binding protein/lipopolysaccharide transport system ATP-binding protein